MRFRALLCAALILAAAALAGCNGAFTLTGGKTAEITVAAASDLKPGLTAVAADFEKATGATINLTFGSSGLLTRQIENGAPIDIFISADKAYIDQLKAKKFIKAAKPFAWGRLVLIGEEQGPVDLLSPRIKKIAIANPEHAPFGKAAVEAMKSSGAYAKVKDRLVYADNVAQAQEFVRTGNADAAFTALSLAQPAGIVKTIINRRAYAPIEQWIGVIDPPLKPNTVKAFLAYLDAPLTQQKFRSFGVEPISQEGSNTP